MKSYFFFSFLLFMVSAMMLSAQDYCLYNSMKGFNFGEGYSDVPVAILEQPDGKFLLVVEAYISGVNSFRISVARVFPNGNPDPTFGGGDGKITHVFDQRNSVACAALQPDGKILVGGYQAASNGVSGFRSYIARLNTDGSADTEFGNAGSAVVEIPGMGTSITHGIDVLSDGKIKGLSSGVNSGVATFQLEEDGTLDTDYASGGYNYTPVQGMSNAFAEDGVVFKADSSAFIVGKNTQAPGYGFSAVKIDSLGNLDVDFGLDGVVNIPTGNVFNMQSEMALASDGNLLLSGGNSSIGLVIAKIDAETGELMSEFGTDGIVSAPLEVLGMSVSEWLRDEVNEEWILLMRDNSADCGTLRMDDNGNFLSECNAVYANHIYPEVGGTKSYNCGLIDSQGALRIGVYSGASDENDNSASQSFNASWAYYTPPFPSPQVISVNPNSIPRSAPTVISIEGFGLENAQSVELLSATDTISSSAITVISTEEIQVLLLPDMSDQLGLYDLRVHLSNEEILVLNQSVTLSDESLKAAELNLLSRQRILINAQSTFAATYRNDGSGSQIAFPIILINQSPMSTDLDQATVYDYTIDPEMSDFMAFLDANGIGSEILQSSSFQDGANSHSAFLTSDLAAGELGVLQGQITTSEIGVSEQTAYMNPNALVPASGLQEGYVPAPTLCAQEMVEQALTTAIPDLDFSEWSTCFLPAYSTMQSHLASIARSQNFAQLIPFKGSMVKLCYDLTSCLDSNHILTEEEMEAFNAEMALLLANHMVLDEAFPCEDYVEASTFFRSAQKPDLELESAEKSDPWGLGIDFNFCYGCATYNDIEGAGAVDPNEKLGPYHEIGQGYTSDPSFFYTIHFENLDSATAPAKRVLIVDTLDMSKFDLSTLRFTVASWTETTIPLEEETTFYDLRPEQPNILQIDRNLDLQTGVVTWEFLTLDTLSMALTEDVDLGFLPPNVLSPEGMGFVGFEVDLLPDLPSGTVIENEAAIYFDFNEPIITNTYQNTFDFLPPASHVNEVEGYVAGENTALITWESEEEDPSLAFYNIYFNTDGGDDWEIWQLNTNETQAAFTGDLGTTYYFQSIAIDSAMNVEPFEEGFDAFVFLNPVSISEEGKRKTLQLYPNPAQDHVLLNWGAPFAADIRVFDLTGRQVLFEQKLRLGEQHILSVQALAKGCYQVLVSTEEGNYSTQFIKH